MKLYLLLSLVLTSFFTFGQKKEEPSPAPEGVLPISSDLEETEELDETVIASIDDITNMAIYPGCEAYKGNKSDLISCFSSRFSEHALKYLSDMDFPYNSELDRVKASIMFLVDTNGYIIDAKPKAGDEVFFPLAVSTVQKVASRLIQNKTPITPATYEDGTPAVLRCATTIILVNTEKMYK